MRSTPFSPLFAERRSWSGWHQTLRSRAMALSPLSEGSTSSQWPISSHPLASTPSPRGRLERNELSAALRRLQRPPAASRPSAQACEGCADTSAHSGFHGLSLFVPLRASRPDTGPVICGPFSCQASEALPAVMSLSNSIQISSTHTARSNV